LLKHATLDLDLHTTAELEVLLGDPVAERLHLHSWPFSAVERLTTTSGRRWIYKTQRTPTFEPDFYERVRSPLLPGYRLLTRDDTHSTMLFEFVDAPLIRDMHPIGRSTAKPACQPRLPYCQAAWLSSQRLGPRVRLR
jgi:hypothetical protein